MNGAKLLIRCLEAEGVDTIFGYPGGAIMPVYDALLDSTIRHILCRHEQGCGFAAQGVARSTGRVGVCMATSGPGATNLITPLADAHIDSVPIVAITGQVPSSLIGTDAFQEADILGMTLPVVKMSWIVESADDIPTIVRDAFRIAQEGRPGPVLIDFPKNVGQATTDKEPIPPPARVDRPPAPDESDVARARELIAQAKRPVVYAGGGVVLADAIEEFRTFVDRGQFPVVHTLKGLGGVLPDNEGFLGMLGMHGLKAANLAVQESDLLICVGARFDDRATGKLDAFAPNAAVIHLDVDPAELGKLRRATVGVAGDIRPALTALTMTPDIEPWRRHCRELAETHAWCPPPSEQDHIDAPSLLRRLSERASEDTIFACDVGQHQMWVAQHVALNNPRKHLTSGGLGSMGFGLSAAMGAAFANPGTPVVCVTGDGSLMMNIQELATVRRYNIPVRILLFDNTALGMVRQWQELFFDNRESEVDLSDNPDFAQVAEAFGIPAVSIDRADQMELAIDHIVSDTGPVLVHVKIPRGDNVWPLVPPLAPNDRMLDGATS
ncbi:MAG: acetolactate synthase 2 catalytic subunit [Planctomycetes bacterium]|nr:acetolactate synthase 2 catalytic subunit [Planctomycetota bacterium]